MRLILFFLTLIILSSCQAEDKEIYGKWYASNFGVLHILADSIVFFPNNLPSETWLFDKQAKQYKYSGTHFKHCALSGQPVGLLEFERVDYHTLFLKKVNDCFPSVPFTSDLRLQKVPDDLTLNFDHLLIIGYQNDQFKEIRLSPKEIENISTSYSGFSIQEALWLLFCSGTIKEDNSDRFVAIQLKLKAEHFLIEKNIHRAKVPVYLRSLIVQFLAEE